MLWMVLMMTTPAQAMLGEEDDTFTPVPPKPRVELRQPTANEGIGAGGRLAIRAAGTHVVRLEVVLSWTDGTLKLEADGADIEQTALVPPVCEPVTVTLRGYAASGASAATSVTLKAPRDTLIDDMIAWAREQAEDSRTNLARADDPGDPGTCKNFIARMLDHLSESYAMAGAPQAGLKLPLNAQKEDCRPYRYGVMWQDAPAQEGNPFVEVGRFRQADDKTREQNEAQAAAFLCSARRGDVLQFVGNYVDGNGPHTILLTEDCDAQTLVFTDSNRKGKRVGGVRYGWVQFGSRRTVAWLAEVLSAPGCGATLYRLREDIIRK